ncbi:MAG TPA: efflux RND transporter periplasmic adaptor subunit [Anaerolineae bacterium]|nr:efflux RND transporter periplasmic adaptor subunit [Anaerolineae bacterium]
MNTLKKYKFWIIGGVIVLLGLAAFGLNRANSSSAAETEIGDTAVAFIGDLSESATASGQIAAQQKAALSLAASGIVDQVLVDVGDQVSAGDVLVQLDTAALERAVASAQADVAVAQANLDKLLTGPDAADLASAEAAVASAQVKLDDLLDGPTEEEIAASAASVKAAQANTWGASGKVQASNEVSEADILAAEADLQDALDKQQAAHDTWVMLADCEVNDAGTYSCTPSDHPQMDAATQNVEAANAQVAIAQARLEELRSPDSNNVASSQASLASAAAQYDAAVARHEALLAGATAEEIAAAEADLANAQATLDKLLEGSSDTDIQIQEIRLAQAETSLRDAQLKLANATLTAPFAGVVTAVHVSEGELASGLAVEIVDPDSLEAVLSVDEIDVGQLAVGQPAIVTLEPWPDAEITGEITAISPSAANNGGLVTYDVHLSLANTDLPVRVGMTANANLLTESREDVLLVPNAALTADREKGTYTVNLVRTAEDGTTEITQVEVTIGLKDNQYTQITSGLVAGDVVLLDELRAPTETGSFGPPR